MSLFSAFSSSYFKIRIWDDKIRLSICHEFLLVNLTLGLRISCSNSSLYFTIFPSNHHYLYSVYFNVLYLCTKLSVCIKHDDYSFFIRITFFYEITSCSNPGLNILRTLLSFTCYSRWSYSRTTSRPSLKSFKENEVNIE